MILEIPKSIIKKGSIGELIEEITNQIDGSIATYGTKAGNKIKISSYCISQIELAIRIIKKYSIKSE